MHTYFQIAADIFKNDRYFRWFIRGTLPLLAVCFFLLVWFWDRLPPKLPLYYSVSWGEDQLASPTQLGLFVFFITLLWGIHVVAAFLLYTQSVYVSRLLLIGSTLTAGLGLFTIIRIIFLIT